MGKKFEQVGYLYLVENYYDQYEVNEICFNEDIKDVFYKDLDFYSYKNYEWKHAGGYCGAKDKAIKNIEHSKYLSDILQEKFDLIPGKVEENRENQTNNYDYGGNTYTFMPKTKRVKITIEEIEDKIQ